MTEIGALIEKFRSGDEDGALRGLIELPDDAVPELIGRFRTETLAPVRALLVKALWERRAPSLIQFLGEALRDSEEEVWQEALDGLVALASNDALAALHAARLQGANRVENDRRFELWIQEAIEQVKFEIRR